MQIESVKIKNFRCFKEAEIDFQLCHALVGENGTGKTSVLEAISLAASSGLSHLSEQDFNNEDVGDLSIEVTFNGPFLNRVPDGYVTQDIPCKSVMFSAHRREKAAPGKALSDPFVIEKFSVPIEYDKSHIPDVATGTASRVTIPIAVSKTANGYESPRKTSSSKFSFTPTRLTLQNEMINFPDVFYFDRDREEQARVGYNSLLQKMAKDLNWRFRKNWNSNDIMGRWDSFYQSVISTVIDSKNDRLIRPIQEKLKSVAGIDFSDLELSLLDIEQPFSKSFFARRGGTNQIEQRRFGSGISILIAYFLLETISKLSKEAVIFLIDEPELHLHPQLQNSLFHGFLDSDIQTIYTTQSDCFINISEWRSVTRFTPQSEILPDHSKLDELIEGQMLAAHLDEIKKWHQHQSIFFREDNQLLFARKCLLVEGPAEKYGLPILAQKLGKCLADVTIISCNGKTKIPYYQLLCKAFLIPFFTLFDLDSGTCDAGDNKRPYSFADPAARFTFTTSFEKVFGLNENDHKTSELLMKLDQIVADDIPQEIKDAFQKIDGWLGNS